VANNIKRYCTVQVDLDGLWVIGKLIGRDFPLEPDPLFEEGTLRLLALFDRFGIKATFFAVARDLESAAKRRMLQEIVARGHEIASHGLLHRYLTRLLPMPRSLPKYVKARERLRKH
jgi:peptidoglycan-N-acetylglucosamine deacetylase